MILLWIQISYMKLHYMQLNQASKLAKPAPAHYSSISHYSCPLGWVQRFNPISLIAFPSVNFTLIHLQATKAKSRFCAVYFTGLWIFASKSLEDSVKMNWGSNRSVYTVSHPPIFKKVSALVTRRMFCKEAPLGTVRSVPGIRWTWGHAVRAPEKCSD